MTKGRHATDCKTGGLADNVGVDTGALVAAGSEGEFLFVELVGTADQCKYDFAIDGEDEALHDLAEGDADGVGGVLGGFCPFGKAANLDGEASGLGGGADFCDVGVGAFGTRHKSQPTDGANGGHRRILFGEGEYPGRETDRFGFVNTAEMPGAAGESWERPSAKHPFAEGEPMKCPNCPDSKLTLAERQGIEIDYCPDCRGVWLDRGELDKIIERASSAMESAQPQRPQQMPSAPMPQQAQPQPMPMGSHKYHSKYHTGYYGKKRKSFLGEIFDF